MLVTKTWAHFSTSPCMSGTSALDTTRHRDPDDVWCNIIIPKFEVVTVWDWYKPESPVNALQEVIDLSVQSERDPVSFLSCRRLDECGCFFPRGTRCIIDGWLIGNSITQRLLGWQTVGHRYPVRTIELEHRRERKVSFRDASPLPADLPRTPKGHSLVHSLTDDLPNNCSF